MIKYIKKDPTFIQISLLMSALFIFIYVLFTFAMLSQFNDIHKNQVQVFQSIVGSVIEKAPELEVPLIQSLFNPNETHEQLGAEILSKYDYNLEMDVMDDPNFVTYRTTFITRNIALFTVLVCANVGLILFLFKKLVKPLEQFSQVLDHFIRGNYSLTDEMLNEGVISLIFGQLDQLGKIISLTYSKLEAEKEHAKALVTDISHQLKTPLASINMCNSILADDLSVEEKSEFLEMSEYNVNKLNTLIDSLVNISKLEVAMIKLKPESNDLKSTVMRACQSVKLKAKDKGVSLEIKPLHLLDEMYVKHDAKWTEEAIFNLLDNAVKYTPSGGHIHVSLEESLNHVKVIVKDTGIGIDKKEFNSVFKRFYRAKDEAVMEIDGVGVGLYLSRKILEEQGGGIFLKSQKGVGSQFTVMLQK